MNIKSFWPFYSLGWKCQRPLWVRNFRTHPAVLRGKRAHQTLEKTWLEVTACCQLIWTGMETMGHCLLTGDPSFLWQSQSEDAIGHDHPLVLSRVNAGSPNKHWTFLFTRGYHWLIQWPLLITLCVQGHNTLVDIWSVFAILLVSWHDLLRMLEPPMEGKWLEETLQRQQGVFRRVMTYRIKKPGA